MIARRDFVALVGAGALAAPWPVPAQPPGRVWRVGYLAAPGRPPSIDASHHGGLPQGLRDLGYVEGRNLAIEWRFAGSQPGRLPALATELVQQKANVIVTLGSPATFAAQKATTTIPIVFIGPGDPVGFGLVKSLARPGANTTGFSSNTTEIGAKRLEMLRAMVPGLSRAAVLFNPDTRVSVAAFENILAAAPKLGVTVLRADARTPQEIESAFATIRREKAGALIVNLDTFFEQQRGQIAELAIRHHLPSIAADQIYTEAGCLMSYGSSLAGLHRRAAIYVDKIFKGARAGDLPVELPTKFDLVINGRTAKALGLKIPQSLLISAEKVIE